MPNKPITKAPLTSPPPQKPTTTTLPLPQIITITPPSPSPPPSLARTFSSSTTLTAPSRPRSRIPPPRYYATNLSAADKASLARGEKNHNLRSWDVGDILYREAMREALVPGVGLEDFVVEKEGGGGVERKTGKDVISFDDFLVPHGSGKGETHRDWVGKGDGEDVVRGKEKEKGGLVVPSLSLNTS